eukprot:gene31546-40963_t
MIRVAVVTKNIPYGIDLYEAFKLSSAEMDWDFCMAALDLAHAVRYSPEEQLGDRAVLDKKVDALVARVVRSVLLIYQLLADLILSGDADKVLNHLFFSQEWSRVDKVDAVGLKDTFRRLLALRKWREAWSLLTRLTNPLLLSPRRDINSLPFIHITHIVEIAALCSLNALLAHNNNNNNNNNNHIRDRVAWPLLCLRRYWYPNPESVLTYRFQVFLRLFTEEDNVHHLPVLLESFVRLLSVDESISFGSTKDIFFNECLAGCGGRPDLIMQCIQALALSSTPRQEGKVLGTELVGDSINGMPSGMPQRPCLTNANCESIANSLQRQYSEEMKELLLSSFDLKIEQEIILKMD